MAQRHIQFYRNGAIYNDRTAALAQVESFKVNLLPSMKDGEMVIFRYNAPTEEKPNATGAIIGYVYNKNNLLDLYVIDIADLNVDEIEERLEEIEEEINNIKFVKKVEQVLKENTSYTESETDLYKVTSNNVTGGQETNETFQLMFTPVSPLALTVPQDIGDIKQGTTAEQLSHESLSKILDDILFKTIYPTLTAPKLTATWSGYNSNTIYEYGSTAPTTANMKPTFTNGTYVINDGVHTTPTAYTPNTPTYSYTGFDSATFTQLGPNNYTVKATYPAATQEMEIKDSKGKKATKDSAGHTIPSNPASSGELSAQLTLKVSLPLYIRRNSQSQGTGKQTLKAWGQMIYEYQMESGTMTGDTALVIESPRTVSNIEVYNPLSSKYEIEWIDNFTHNTQTINNYTYHVYTWNGPAAGAEKIRITTV